MCLPITRTLIGGESKKLNNLPRILFTALTLIASDTKSGKNIKESGNCTRFSFQFHPVS